MEKEDELAVLLSDKAKEIPDQMRDKRLYLSVANEKKAFIETQKKKVEDVYTCA